jgi:phosphomannomutase
MKIPIAYEDLSNIVEAIFEVDEVIVYEMYSEYQKELKIFTSPDQVFDEIEQMKVGTRHQVLLSLHYENAAGYVQPRRIELDPLKCNGANFRYSIEGWGLIHVQLSLKENRIHCNISANSEKRAQKWEETFPELKSASLWNWAEVNKQKSRLNRVLRKSA